MMKVKVYFIIFLGLILITVTELLVYREWRNRAVEINIVYEKSRNDFERLVSNPENIAYESNTYGYGDILDLLNKNLGVKITKFEKNEVPKGKIIAQIEFISEDNKLDEVVSSIYEMKNFYGIHKLIIRSSDSLKNHIIINGEFKIK